MAPPVLLLFLLISIVLAAASSFASGAVVEYTFHVQNLTVNRLCENRVITTVNGMLPGPTLRAQEGDTVIAHVFNESPYNMTIHWHGIFQKLTGWADGPAYVTQCPIVPGRSYTYKFNITGQEGTLWWHAHISFLRATVYGAIEIRPRAGCSYPFKKPYKEYPIIFGEWWNANVVDIENEAIENGGGTNLSNAFTINGQPGHLYNCSSDHMYMIKVRQGKTYLLRIINAALNSQLFFKIADHKFTVVAVDASYTNPYLTDVVVIAPGQSADVLLTADQKPGLYYMAARPYISTTTGLIPENTTTTGLLAYEGAATTSTPKMPLLPDLHDTQTANKFYTSLTALVTSPFWAPVPRHVDEELFVTTGFNLVPCANSTCKGPLGQRLAASMNNASFQAPNKMSILQAFFQNVDGIYTADFPKQPPIVFDYTNPNNKFNPSLILTEKSTKVVKLKFNSTVQIVLQNTAIIGFENHPMHTHGFSFKVLAQGFGNYDPAKDSSKFNFVNPQELNTIAVPVGGWAVIRFTADNPGVWFLHCHLETHVPWGMAMVIAVENGPTPSTTLPPPPYDYPKC